MRIKPLKPGIRFYLWRLLHPRQYAKHRDLFQNIDEMHEYGRRWSEDELHALSTPSRGDQLDHK